MFGTRPAPAGAASRSNPFERTLRIREEEIIACHESEYGIAITGSIAAIHQLFFDQNVLIRTAPNFAGPFLIRAWVQDPGELQSNAIVTHVIVQEIPDVPLLENSCVFQPYSEYAANIIQDPCSPYYLGAGKVANLTQAPTLYTINPRERTAFF